jgi:hypothetical protein
MGEDYKGILGRTELAMGRLVARVLCVFAFSAALFAFAPFGSAVTVDLTSGTAGSLLINQSFNGETRSADVSLLGGVSRVIRSMTVSDVDIRDTIEPRING